MDLIEKVFRFTEEKALFTTPCKLLLGLSGGADSMALLHILCHWPQAGLSLCALHVNHGIRGAEAQRDEVFVRQQCAAFQVPLQVVHVDVPAVAAQKHMGIEEVARSLRYTALKKTAAELNATAIVTAHTASDQIETVLQHILRGCGVSGLRGIPASRDSIVRPLLATSRREIEAYCRENAVPFVVDSTNVDVRYTRNYIRHRILPAIRQTNPGADEALLRLRDAAEEDDDCLYRLADQALADASCGEQIYCLSSFAAVHPAISLRMMRRALAEVGCRSLEQRHWLMLRRMMAEGRGVMALPGGWSVQIAADRLSIDCGEAKAPILPKPQRVVPPCRILWGEQEVDLLVVNNPSQIVHRLFFKTVIDCDKIQGDLWIRCRETGDRLHPVGRHVGKTVKTLMNEAKIPPQLRDGHPLLCDDQGIVLIPGVCCDERVRPDAHTKHFLVWSALDRQSLQ